MKKIKILVLLSVIFNLHAAEIINLPYSQPLTKVDALKGNTVFLVKDAIGNKFVIKQHNEQAKVIRELMGYELGKGIVNIPYATTIAVENISNMMLHNNKLLTLHAFIPGYHNERDLILGGITADHHLHNIACNHKSLAQIVALNLFINNLDCHRKNLLEFLDKFYVIDMDHAFYFCDNLAEATYNYLKTIKENSLSKEEIDALKVVDKTLVELIKKYPPKETLNLWDQLAHNNKYDYDKDTMNQFFKNNYDKTLLVHSELERLTNWKNYLSSHCITNYVSQNYVVSNAISLSKRVTNIL